MSTRFCLSKVQSHSWDWPKHGSEIKGTPPHTVAGVSGPNNFELE